MRRTGLATARGGVLAIGGLLGIGASLAAAQGDSYRPHQPYYQPPVRGHATQSRPHHGPIDARPEPVHQPRGHVDVQHGPLYRSAPSYAQPHHQPAPAHVAPARVGPHGDYMNERPGRAHQIRGRYHHELDEADHH